MKWELLKWTLLKRSLEKPLTHTPEMNSWTLPGSPACSSSCLCWMPATEDTLNWAAVLDTT